MLAKVLHIKERSREKLSMPLSLDDFTTTEDGEVNADFVFNSSAVSLCCFDNTNRRAIFAEMPSDVDPAKAPFFYQSQFENALRLFAVDYDNYFDLAQQAKITCSKFVFVHNIGRCGSTLLHKAFSKVKEVVSLSEPDVLGQIRYLRTKDGSQDSHLLDLIQSSVPLLFKTSNQHQADVGIIKLRNQSIDDIDLFWKAFPDAHHLFLYRSTVGWAGSIYGRRLRRDAPLAVDLIEAHASWESYHNRPIRLADYGLGDLPATISAVEQLAISWLMMMDKHLHFYESGIRMPALRYDELNSKSSEALESLFRQINLPMNAVGNALEAFGEDSQAGTRLARPDPKKGSSILFSDNQIEQMKSILQKHPNIGSIEYVAPATMLL